MNRIFSKLATQREVFAKDQQLEQLITELTAVNFSLVTTPKTQIIDNRILLSSKPEGDLLFNMMRVYDESGTTWDYDEVTVEEENGFFYAALNEPFGIIGHGVVSYLEMTIL